MIFAIGELLESSFEGRLVGIFVVLSFATVLIYFMVVIHSLCEKFSHGSRGMDHGNDEPQGEEV